MLEDALTECVKLGDDEFGSEETTNAGKILRMLWEKAGTKAFVEWIRRVVVLVQQKKILFCELCEQDNRGGEIERSGKITENESATCKKNNASCSMRYLWELGIHRSASPRQEPDEQFARKLNTFVQKLSCEAAPCQTLMRCLRIACEGSRSMREALASVEEEHPARLGHRVYIQHQESDERSKYSQPAGIKEENWRDVNVSSTIRANESTSARCVVQNGVECLNPWDSQTIRQYAVDAVYPANTSNETGGQNRQGVCYAFHLQQDPISSAEKVPCIGGQHQACIGVAAFMGGQGAKAGSVAYSEDIAPTIKSVMSGGNTIPDCVYPNTARCLEARHDSSPCVDRGQNFCVYALQGNGIDRADTAGCNGCGWRENECYTLNTIDRPAVVHPEIVGALNATDYKGIRNQNVLDAVVYDCRGNGDGKTAANLTGDHENRVTDYTNCCVFDRQAIGVYGENGVSSTLAQRDYKDPTDLVVQKKPRKYIVRRLTPLECCRLQGFSDWWCDGLIDNDLSDNEIEFWKNIFDTYSSITGTKAKSEKQIRKWLAEEPADSSIYKMWGNGVNLPCVDFVMSGITEALYGDCKHDSI